MSPHDCQIPDRQELVELESDSARAPHIGDLDDEGGGVVGTARSKGVVHPIGRVDILDAGPDATDLHGLGAVNEGFVGAGSGGVMSDGPMENT